MLKQIQVEKLIAKKICQFRTYRALADTGYASEKYPHVAILVLGLCHRVIILSVVSESRFAAPNSRKLFRNVDGTSSEPLPDTILLPRRGGNARATFFSAQLL